MRPLLLILLMSVFYTTSFAQFVARMEVKEPIPGLCNDKEVYALLPSFKGQKEAVCPLSKEAIEERLNSEVQFLKDHSGYEDKGMMGLVINCKGDVVRCKMDNKTKSPELDQQIEAVFNSLGEWKAGKLNNRNVDTSKLFSFNIGKGKLALN